MSKEHILSREEEQSLFKKYKETKDADAYEKIIICNQGLVASIAKDYLRPEIEIEDLVSEGNIGLMRAIEKFDHKKGFKFSTYAVWWIRQGIIRYLNNEGRTIRLPVHAQEKLIKINNFIKSYVEEHGTEPSYKEIGEAIGASEDNVKFYITSSGKTSSLQKTVGDDGTEIIEFIPDEEPTPQEQVELKESDMILRRAMDSCLNDKERFIIRTRFGLDGFKRYTLSEVGDMLGITRERVRQIEKKALIRLRHKLESEDAA